MDATEELEMMKAREVAAESVPWLLVYAQKWSHYDARIEGNRLALTNLRDAIDRALRLGVDSRSTATVPTDGEGYEVVVRIRSFGSLENAPLPYTDL